jgi:preprotein translocase subunit SecG
LTTVLLIIYLFVALALIGVVLIQRSEGGGLGIGSSQGMGSFMSGRGTANLLTRTTAILAAIFLTLALLLGWLNRGTSGATTRSILDTPAPASSSAPAGSGAPGSGASGSGAPGTGAPGTGAPGSDTSSAGTGTSGAPPVAPPAVPTGPSAPTN